MDAQHFVNILANDQATWLHSSREYQTAGRGYLSLEALRDSQSREKAIEGREEKVEGRRHAYSLAARRTLRGFSVNDG